LRWLFQSVEFDWLFVMASGFGANGGPGRCFSPFQNFQSCVSGLHKKGEQLPKECSAFMEDYIECLHFTKQRTYEAALHKALNEYYHRGQPFDYYTPKETEELKAFLADKKYPGKVEKV